MLNEQKIEYLRTLIQQSTLLSDHEKSDWLNLLELMNDKQISELEEILLPEQVEKKAPAPVPGMPSLSHISNLPTDLSVNASPRMVPSRPAPPRMPAPPAPTTKPAPAPPAASSMPQTPPAPPMKPRANVPPTLPAAEVPPGQFIVQVPARQSVEKPVLNKTRPLYKVSSVPELQAISLEILREYDKQSIVNTVQELTAQYGYFAILAQLEASPLYKSYLDSGKRRLGTMNNSVPSENDLTQAEFEFVIDILRSLRINRPS